MHACVRVGSGRCCGDGDLMQVRQPQQPAAPAVWACSGASCSACPNLTTLHETSQRRMPPGRCCSNLPRALPRSAGGGKKAGDALRCVLQAAANPNPNGPAQSTIEQGTVACRLQPGGLARRHDARHIMRCGGGGACRQMAVCCWGVIAEFHAFQASKHMMRASTTRNAMICCLQRSMPIWDGDACACRCAVPLTS